MNAFKNKQGRSILLAMVKAIEENKQYLGDIDSLIGDGDHGMNMDKGFIVYAESLGENETEFGIGLDELGMILFNKIGGSVGPIYGTLFISMGETCADAEEIDLELFIEMLQSGLEGLYEIVDARPGDKTLIDTLYPAIIALNKAKDNGKDFAAALKEMKDAADAGCKSTENMVAKYGRSSRLGEQSKGALDAGSCSCKFILNAMADAIQTLL